METEINLKKIKVYCYEHQAICEVRDKPQIACTIEEHTLASDFPHADFWEYCCDCQTFFPTKPDISGKVVAHCPNCDRAAARRFVCQDCQIVSFDSDEPARGKIHHLSGVNGIKPDCPGCQTISPNNAANLHDCPHIKSEFYTSRPTCPFCLEQIVKTRSSAIESSPTDRVLFCSQCHAKNPPNAVFCGKCKNQLRTDVAVSNLGSDVNKTQLLGSLCPNCSTPIPPDSDFCGECGQAVKKAIPPPPPPPQKIVGDTSTFDFSVPSSTNSVPNNTVRNVIIGVGGFFLLVVIVTGISKSTKPSSSSANTPNLNSMTVVNSNLKSGNKRPSNTPTNSAVSMSNAPNKSNSDYRIGKTGTLNVDANLRDLAGKIDAVNWLGTHYRGARVKILDVETITNSNGSTTDWFKIEITSYGSSMDPNKYGESGKDPGSEDVGWVNSYPEVYDEAARRKKRVVLINLD